MSTMQLRSLPGSALDARRQPLRPVAPARCSFLPVRAVLPSSRPTVTARAVPGGAAQPGIPSDYNRPPGGIPPSSIVIEGPITATGGPGSGQRPVPRTGGGGGGSGSGSGGSSGPSSGAGGSSSGGGLPGGWSWDRVLLTLLGIALAVPAWKYVNRRFINKPEPEHTLTKVEDKAAEVKHRNAVGKAVHSVKEHTIEPVAAAVGAGVQAVKHNDIVRGVQHKAEDAKDAIDTTLHGAGHKAEHNAYKAKKETKHAADHAAEKADDAKHKASNKAHEAAVKGGRALQHGKEKVTDAVYGAEAATGKATKSMLENIKGAAHTVGRKLHVVADSTEKGIKKGADNAEKATGTKHSGLPYTDNSDRTKAYVIGGTVIGTGVLAAAIYYWDRNGGDVKGKLNKFQTNAKNATDKALNRAQQASEPAKPPSNTTSYKPPATA